MDFRLRGRWSRWKYGRCARVIAVSRAVAAVLRRDGLPEDRLRVVYEGVPDRSPRPGGTDALDMLVLCMEGGVSLEEWLDAFPSVTREQAIAVLEYAHKAIFHVAA